VPDGDKLFSIISKYDDVLADVVRKPGYNAGDTLKLVLPFLKAYDVTDRLMEEFSAANLILIAAAETRCSYVRSITEAFIVSTSYEHYIRAFCRALGFPFENTYCTEVSIDKYKVAAEEKAKLKNSPRNRFATHDNYSSSIKVTTRPLAERQETVKRLTRFSGRKSLL